MAQLEQVNIISISLHKIHHQHRDTNKSDAERWFDLWMPNIFYQFYEKYWQFIVKKHVVGKQYMSIFSTDIAWYTSILLAIGMPAFVYMVT